MNGKIIPSFIGCTITSYHSTKYFRMTLIRTHLYSRCVIILGDFRRRAGVTSHGCYQSLVYQVRRYIYTEWRYTYMYIYIHSSRFPSMALLSLCIKPLSPITLTPRQSRLSVSHLPQPPHLSRFHPCRFNPFFYR